MLILRSEAGRMNRWCWKSRGQSWEAELRVLDGVVCPALLLSRGPSSELAQIWNLGGKLCVYTMAA